MENLMKRWIMYVGFVGLLFAGRAAVPMAHEGHAHKVMGTVATVHENHVEVKDKDGRITTHLLNPKTKIRRGKAVATIADIEVGDRVVVTTIESKDKAGKIVKTVTQVEIGAAGAATTKK
jgi:hypothetical protein